MRWLFVGIVALNVLYLGWHLVMHRGAPAEIVAAVPSTRTFPSELQLLGAGVAPVARPPAQANVAPVGCPAIGPFASADVAADTLERLADGGIQAVQQSAGKSGVPVYWVYLPPHESRQQALRKLRELHAAGIDSFIVAEGADANAVSLGSFGNRDSALGLQARLRAAGYGALVREQVKAGSDTWLLLKSPEAQGYMEFVPAPLQAGLRVDRRPCP